ncbi:MAG: MoxR family ATPase, partial [Alcanivorax sp.]|nr:MoxR family ATPase [Alcanivorax sp.]
YPLPEAELDRFVFKVLIDYPAAEDETALVKMVLDGTIAASLEVDSLTPVADADAIAALKQLTGTVLLDPQVLDYALRLVRTTRDFPGLVHGASPRASIALARAARAQALFEGRDFVTPDDVQQVAKPVLRHRIQLSADAEIEGQSPESVLARLLAQVEAPRQ